MLSRIDCARSSQALEMREREREREGERERGMHSMEFKER
jgi:hypothetical protein